MLSPVHSIAGDLITREADDLCSRSITEGLFGQGMIAGKYLKMASYRCALGESVQGVSTQHDLC